MAEPSASTRPRKRPRAAASRSPPPPPTAGASSTQDRPPRAGASPYCFTPQNRDSPRPITGVAAPGLGFQHEREARRFQHELEDKDARVRVGVVPGEDPFDPLWSLRGRGPQEAGAGEAGDPRLPRLPSLLPRGPGSTAPSSSGAERSRNGCGHSARTRGRVSSAGRDLRGGSGATCFPTVKRFIEKARNNPKSTQKTVATGTWRVAHINSGVSSTTSVASSCGSGTLNNSPPQAWQSPLRVFRPEIVDDVSGRDWPFFCHALTPAYGSRSPGRSIAVRGSDNARTGAVDHHHFRSNR